MSGEHVSLQYLAVVPADGPWILIIGPPGEETHVGPFRDSEDLLRWYWLHGDGQPPNAVTLVDPGDYPGASVNGDEPLSDPQRELPLDGND